MKELSRDLKLNYWELCFEHFFFFSVSVHFMPEFYVCTYLSCLGKEVVHKRRLVFKALQDWIEGEVFVLFCFRLLVGLLGFFFHTLDRRHKL